MISSCSCVTSMLGGGGGDTPDEPHQSLSCRVRLGLELVPDEVLEILRLEGRGQLPFP